MIVLRELEQGYYFTSEEGGKFVGPFIALNHALRFIKKFVGEDQFVMVEGYPVLWQEDDFWYWSNGVRRGPFQSEPDALHDLNLFAGTVHEIDRRNPSTGMAELPIREVQIRAEAARVRSASALADKARKDAARIDVV